jgi:hypothetical protein
MEKWKKHQINGASREMKGYTLTVQPIFVPSMHKNTDDDEEVWKWTVSDGGKLIEMGHDVSYDEACRSAEYCVKEITREEE